MIRKMNEYIQKELSRQVYNQYVVLHPKFVGYFWKTASKSNTEHYAKFFWGMIEQGIYLPCSQFEALFFSMMHTDQDIHRTVAAAEQVLLGLASEN